MDAVITGRLPGRQHRWDSKVYLFFILFVSVDVCFFFCRYMFGYLYIFVCLYVGESVCLSMEVFVYVLSIYGGLRMCLCFICFSFVLFFCLSFTVFLSCLPIMRLSVKRVINVVCLDVCLAVCLRGCWFLDN